MSDRQTRSIPDLWTLVIIILVAFLIIWFTFKPVEESIAEVVESQLALWLVVLITLLFAIITRMFGYASTRQGLVNVLLTAGFTSWVAAEIIWFVAYVILDTSPYPLLDGVWTIGYVLIVTALALNARLIRVKLTQAQTLVWLILSLLLSVAVAVLIVLPLLEDFTVDVLVNLIYPIGDVLTIVVALSILIRFRSGEVARAWIILLVGFLLTAVGDILYIYAEIQDLYTVAYNVMDLFLLLGYAAFLYSALLFIRTYES